MKINRIFHKNTINPLNLIQPEPIVGRKRRKAPSSGKALEKRQSNQGLRIPETHIP